MNQNIKNQRIYIIAVFLLILFSSKQVYCESSSTINQDKPKIGLVLSGGGALGFAHIPILKAIDSLEIPIDYIAGTSMGGIASALYSIGYTGAELEYLVKNVDWNEIFTDEPDRDLIPYFIKKDDGLYQFHFGFDNNTINPPSGLIRGQKISLFFSKLTYPFEKIKDFDLLPIPFRCVAVDLLTANEVVLKSGSLSKAMRSTMAIPTIFNPVSWGDSLLIDGGLVNNVPVDVVKEMGADFVIAVNVGRPLKKRSELNSMFDMLEQTLVVPSIKKHEENIQNADIFIEPQLHDYNPALFTNDNIDNIIVEGENVLRSSLQKLIELKNDLNPSENEKRILNTVSIRVFSINILGNYSIPFKDIYEKLNIVPGQLFNQDTLIAHIQHLRETNLFQSIKYKLDFIDEQRVGIQFVLKELGQPSIHRLSIKNNTTTSFNTIFNLLDLQIGSIFDIDLLNERINELYSTGYFETIRYEIEPVKENAIHLIVYVEERPQDEIHMGLHYDETYKFVGSINLIKSSLFNSGLRSETTLRIAGLTYFNSILYLPRSGNSFSLYPYAQMNYKDIPLNIFDESGKKFAIYHNRSSSIGLGIGFSINHDLDLKVEANMEFINVTPIVSPPDPFYSPEWKDKLTTIRSKLHFDNIDNVFLPNRGLDLTINYEGSYINIGSDIKYVKGSLILDYYKTLTERTVFHFYTFNGYGEEELPGYKFHYVGGPDSFIGTERSEMGYYRLSLFRFDLRQQLRNNMFLSLIYNFTPNYGGDFYPIDKQVIQGAGIGFTYNTAMGPIELIYSRGDKINNLNPSKKSNVYYLTMGFNID